MTDQISKADIDAALAEAKRQIADNWGWFLALGLLLIVAGVAAIAFPLLSTVATKIALGWIFLVAGVVLVVHAFSIQGWRGFLLGLLVGALYVVAGGWLAFFPFTGIDHADPPAGGAVPGRGRAGSHDGRCACARTRDGAGC